MISVAEALDRIFSLLTPLGSETVPLRAARGRVLASDAVARRDQPPFDAAVMDGYAVASSQPLQGETLRIVGEAAAGHALQSSIDHGEAARIFTGAPMPAGTCRVIMQENTARTGDAVRILEDDATRSHVRPVGMDFRAGDKVESGRLLKSADLVLLASMNLAQVTVFRRPVVAILSMGDELLAPGSTPGPDQIIASNGFGLAALAEECGAEALLLPIIADRTEILTQAFALTEGADLVVTSGGASVGDYDLLGRDLTHLGLNRDFYKVAMRPGKPLMAGRLGDTPLLGLPGNPVSSIVCGVIFMQPALRCLQGLPPSPAPRRLARLTAPLPANGAREHYMRANLDGDDISAMDNQDSSLQRVLSNANALLVRAPHAPPGATGELVEYVDLRP